MVEELRIAEKMTLFAIFPIGTIMQDGGKRRYILVVSLSSNILLKYLII